MSAAELLAELDRTIAQGKPEERPALVVALAGLLVALASRLVTLAAGPAAPAPPAASAAPALPEDSARCLSPEELAGLLSIPASRVYDLLKQRRLPGYKEGRYWVTPLVALREHVQKRLDGLSPVYKTVDDVGGGTSPDPNAARAHPGRVRGARGRPLEHGRPLGARRGADHARDGEAGAAGHEVAEAEAKA